MSYFGERREEPQVRLGRQYRQRCNFDHLSGLTEFSRFEEAGLRTNVGERLRRDGTRSLEFIGSQCAVEYRLHALGVGVVAACPPDGNFCFADHREAAHANLVPCGS